MARGMSLMEACERGCAWQVETERGAKLGGVHFAETAAGAAFTAVVYWKGHSAKGKHTVRVFKLLPGSKTGCMVLEGPGELVITEVL